jgi:hypothetical protein
MNDAPATIPGLEPTMHRPSTFPQGYPSLPEIKRMALEALVFIDTAVGIANTSMLALGDDYTDTRACFQGIVHLLHTASDEVSMIEQYLQEMPAEEDRP